MINWYCRAVDAVFPIAILLGVHSVIIANPWSERYMWLGAVASVLLVLFTQLLGGYRRYELRTIARKLEVILKSWGYILLGCIFIAFLWGGADGFSQWVFGVWALVTPPLILLAKMFLIRRFAKLKETNVFLILGEWYEFTSFEKNRLDKDAIVLNHCDETNLDHLIHCVEQLKPRGVVLNIKSYADPKLVQVLTRLELEGVKLISMNRFFEQYLRKCFIPYDVIGVDYLDDVKPLSSTQLFFKRVIDLTISVGLLLVVWPVMFYVFFRIKKDSPGPALFKQSRVGLEVHDFQVLKFRSMRIDAEKNGAQFAKENDPRAYPFGTLMRKTRMDELPQIWNVILGDLHFVGPRPERRFFTSALEKEIPFYHVRHLVRPGITGWAQVWYPYGANTEDARQKLMYDLYYIKHWSIWLELETLLRTFLVVFGKKGL